MEIKKLKLESLKALIDGIKIKILLFSGAFGGSFALILKSEKLLPMSFFSIVVFIFLIGIIVNLLYEDKR